LSIDRYKHQHEWPNKHILNLRETTLRIASRISKTHPGSVEGNTGALRLLRIAALCIGATAIYLLVCANDVMAQTRAPESGGTVIAGIGTASIPSLNTQLTSITDALMMASVWADGLMTYDRDGNRIPRIAKSWSISDDGKVYTFVLREGVKWSDGHPFTAQDVVFTMNNFARFNTYVGRLADLVEKAEAPDDKTFVLTLSQPLTATLDLLDKEVFPLLPQHVYAGGDPITHPANRAPVGLGPFKFSAWNNGRSIEFVRNPYYWEQGKPHLDAVIFALIPNPQQRLNALKRGEIDWIQPTPAQFVETRDAAQENNYVFTEIRTNAPSRTTIDFNLRQAPTNDFDVRRALFQAIDRERIVRDGYRGFAATAKNAIPVQFKNLHTPSISYDESYPYDPVAAGKILDEAGYPLKNGKRFELEFTYAITEVLESVAKIVQANWEAIGIDVQLVGLEMQLYIDKIYNKNEFQTSLIYLTGRTNPVLGIDRSFICNKGNVPFANPTGYCNPEFDQLALEAAAAPLDEQKALYKKYAEIVFRDLNSISLTNAQVFEAYSTRFENMEAQYDFAFNSHPNWAEAWLPKNKQ
jgi:peptide/nickel transport system substrate-binding protein